VATLFCLDSDTKITGHTSLRTLTEYYPELSPGTVWAYYDNTDPTARGRARRRSVGF
jgi:hypothetical protein